MKKFLFPFILIYTIAVNSQNIYDYEKEISNKENYSFKEIDFKNDAENLTLSGTLITPTTNFDKIVIIVAGSGKDTRYAHFVLAEEFLKNGIAVYRFDERGIGKSEGQFSEMAEDLSNDLGFAIKKLRKNYKNKKIGVVGHSLGGIATLKMIKTTIDLEFMILIETPVIKNGAFVLHQIGANYEKRIPEVMRRGITKDEFMVFLEGYIKVVNNNNINSLKKEVKKYIKDSGFKKRYVVLLDDPFLTDMATTNLEETLKNTSIKTLYLLGTKDVYIDHIDEYNLVKSFANKNIEIFTFEELNHWLTKKSAIKGTSLYQMDNEPLDLIVSWVLKK